MTERTALEEGQDRSGEDTSYFFARWLFLRGLGVVYLCAFVSLGVQILGLIGTEGISPASHFLRRVYQTYGAKAYHYWPTVCWLDASDTTLVGLCVCGGILAVLLILDVAPILTTFLLWATYLSLFAVGQSFMALQWDILLLEVGFLAVFLSPRQWWPRFSLQQPPSIFTIWLGRWLLFRLMFTSGIVKLWSGDVAWRSLTAMTFHYETQPLPTTLGWLFHQLPAGVHHASTAIVLALELVLPLLIFGTRRMRYVACAGFTLLQVAIMLSGNYGFFNYLSLLLCVLLLDDGKIRRLTPQRWRARLVLPDPPPFRHKFLVSGRTMGLLMMAIVFFVLSFYQTTPRWLRAREVAPSTQKVLTWLQGAWLPSEWMQSVHKAIRPFRIMNNYGLFAVMTKTRPEIQIEGSMDGVRWEPYVFRWKPGSVERAPVLVGPHMPRLDWRMWFAALSRHERHPWLRRMMLRLRQGSPAVKGLFQKLPFDGKPPRYVRAVRYLYKFRSWSEWRSTGQWWSRRKLGHYAPIVGPPGVQIRTRPIVSPPSRPTTQRLPSSRP